MHFDLMKRDVKICENSTETEIFFSGSGVLQSLGEGTRHFEQNETFVLEKEYDKNA